MNAEGMRRAMEIFDEVCDLVGDERAEALTRLAAGDAKLRAEVERMLRYDSQATGPIARSGAGAEMLAAEVGEAEPGVPEKIGRYRVIREIGRGGMGVVYEAEQESPRRRVALKVVQRGLISQAVLSRFHREAQVLGQLQHRGIAHIYESGTARLGESRWPFLAMELVEGRPLDQHAEAAGLSVPQRLELVARVCDAVQHAHQKGIIHRDLKPANVLVVEESAVTGADHTTTTVDAIGQPKILDFGVARFADPEAQQTMQTHAGQIVGTLAYMSPEQLAGRVGAIDTRSDLYALGVILYRLLAGRPPHELGGLPIAEAARVLSEQSPPTLGAVAPALRGDVSTIVAKAIEKDPDRRYASAAAMAEDIRRYLRNEPIEARPASAAYQLRKFARRNRALVGGIVTTFLALLGGLVGVSVLLAKVSAERNAASIAEERAVRIGAFQSEMLRGIDIENVGQRLLATIDRQLEVSGFDQTQIDDVAGRLRPATIVGATIDAAVLSAAVAKLDAGYIDDPLTEAELRGAIGGVFGVLVMPEQQFAQLDRAVSLYSQQLGPDAPETLELGVLRATALHDLHRYPEAVEALGGLLERVKSGPRGDPALAFKIRTCLVSSLIADQRLDDAEAILTEELELLRSLPSPSRYDVFIVEKRLAAVLSARGEHQKAADAYAALVEQVRQENGGQDVPASLPLLNSWAGSLLSAGREAEAEHALRRWIDGSRKYSGDDNEGTILARRTLGTLLLAQGRNEEAVELFGLAQNSIEHSMPPERPLRTAATLEYARSLLALGRLEECVRVVRSLLEARERAGMPADDTDGLALVSILQQAEEARP